uniref:RRM domain-containing protein n=1 Tax=Ditylenchus dipsaci TaxID=166011 RepID=A0A915E1V9_9BILA
MGDSVINIVISKQGFHPIDIRIVRKATDTGIVRVFGFVEFSDSIQAQAWINYNKDSGARRELHSATGFHQAPNSGRREPQQSFFGGASQLLNQFQRLYREFFIVV